MEKLERYGLARFSKKTGKIDTCLTGWGKGVLQMWGLQSTPKTKATVVLNLDRRYIEVEYIGTEDGFPDIHKAKNEDAMEYNVPDELYDELLTNFND